MATLSTGEVFDGAKSYKKLESKLSRLKKNGILSLGGSDRQFTLIHHLS
ncbi:MAG: hypothetical protein MGU50_21390 [Trichodesmium sp. MAG_R02]|nr:hypothetical protein [Trichodesmium sp. MAG_R02]